MQLRTFNNKCTLAINHLWEMSLISSSQKTRSLGSCSASDVEAHVAEVDGKLTCTWQIAEPAQLTVTVVITKSPDQWDMSATITNHDADACVREFAWGGLSLACRDTAMLIPQGAGRRVTDFAAFKPLRMQYPSYDYSMPWLAMDHADDGVYLGIHDPQDHCVDIALEVAGDAIDVNLTQFPFVMPGQTVTLPPIVIKSYDGHWSNAARFYRNWYDSVGKVTIIPDWVRENTGWLLGILKQQNESILYDYNTGIDELADIAIARGLDTLGLFGWTVGGHDHLYPHYDPCPVLGGRVALKAAIKRAKDRGLRVIMYSNGVIMDVATPFYRQQGKDVCNIMINGRVNLSQINKFSDATPVVFATACPSSQQWRKQMLSLAVQAHELGADGLLYDQIGVYGRHECHHPGHDHVNPMDGYASGRVEMIRQIAEHMKQLNPEFVIATESFIAPMARQLHFIHGFGYAYGLTHAAAGTENYPDLLRYTFPEVVCTNRIPQPLMDRNVAHYAVMHGLRQELEIRYADDVKLMRGEQLDWQTAYANVAGSPPKKDMLKAAVAADEKIYMGQLMAMVKRHADVFYHGTYQSELGFELQSDHVQARAHAMDQATKAVVLCNLSDVACEFELTVPGYNWIQTDSPDGVSDTAVTSLDAQSICLMKFEKA